MAKRIEALSAWEIANSSMTTAELRRQYSKQAYVARQRLGKIESAFGSKAEIVQRRAGDFRPLKELGDLNRQQLAQELSSTQKFLASGSSRVKEYGQVRQKIIDSFNENGYDFVNESNLDDLYQFLEDARARHLGSMYGSDQLIETWNRAQKRGMTPEQLLGNIEYWAEKPRNSLRIYANKSTSRADFEEESEHWI
mgnify:FL=1